MRALNIVRRYLGPLLCMVAPVVGAQTPLKWERRAFPLPESIWSVAALDANADGKQDLIAMGVTKVIAVLGPSWTERVLFDAQDGKMLYCVSLDMDRDGDLDLVIGRYQI